MIVTARSAWVGLTALAVGLTLTWAGYSMVAEAERERAEAQLDARSTELSTYLTRRFFRYEQVLRSGVLLFSILPSVSREHWRTFVGHLELDRDYPGTLGVGFAAWLQPEEVPPHVAAVRREGYSDYDVHPAGSRQVYTAVQYLEPFDARNQRAFGYDMLSEATRRAAMLRARDTGEAALSGRVLLLQETELDRQNGVLLYYPVYAAGSEALAPRQRPLRGFVYSPLRMNDLIDGVLGDAFPDLALRIYEGAAADPAHLLYASAALRRGASDAAATVPRLTVDLAGQSWTLEVSPAPGFAAPPGRASLVLIGGGTITLLLTLLLSGLATGRERARAIADRMARAFLQAQQTQRAILDSVAEGVLTIDADGVVTSANPAAEAMFGADESLLVGVPVTELIPDHPALPAEAGPRPQQGRLSERQARSADGRHFPVELSISRLAGGDHQRSGYVESVRDITERKQSEAYIRHLAHHDALTELPNRTLFKDRLDAAIAQARENGRSVGVIMVDLDHFKRINDSLGHQVGDELLLQITARLRSCVGAGDTVARMGGDEFVVVLPDLQGAEDAAHVARQIVDVIASPVRLPGHELFVTPSVGVCLYPQDGTDSMTLLKNADTAMYHAKEQGRNRFSLFSFDMHRLSQQRMRLESALRAAVAQDRLQTYFQPILNTRTGRVSGMEALLRWPGDEGFVPPDVFVPIAEDTGLIGRIGEKMLLDACNRAMEVGLQLGRPVQLAVNVSPHQFHHEDLAGAIRATLEATAFPASWLTVEITERVLVRDPVEAAETLGRLRDLGVGVAIDDFGTGYSSLAYISKFPLNKLKVDRSFVRDLSSDTADLAVINAVIAMGHSLGLTIVAEGVETAEQLAHLRAQDCDEVQGFLFSPAVPAADFVAAVRRLEARRFDVPHAAAAHEVF